MKNPPIFLLIMLTVFIAAFTLGLFVGRNFSGETMSISVPDPFLLPPATAPSSEKEIAPLESEPGFLVDINSASLEELMSLPGIGEVLASDIIAYREAMGPFSYAEELMNVSGIGEGRLESILGRIIVGGNP